VHVKINYRPEIDGLRAVAVIPVIFFHAGFSFFSGGFIGVDVFFVISGYLITTIILKELDNKTFSLKGFYERRARRILPALIFVILISSIISFIFLTRSELASYFRSVNATLLFYSNFHFWKTTPYFLSESDLEPLLHTWSLSIEEQFYFIFPLTLIIFYKFLRKYIFLLFVFGFVSSLLLCQIVALKTGGTLNFYFTFSRAWELALGALCAYTIMYRKLYLSNILKNLLPVIGIALILFSIFFFDRSTIYPSFYTLVPTVGTALIILFANKESFVKKILSIKIFVALGLISYSLYLWHQPLLAFGRVFLDDFSIKIKLSLIFIALISSYLTYIFIEKPFRKKRNIFKINFFKKIASLIIVIGIFSLTIIQTFKNNSIFSTESILAKNISEGSPAALPAVEKRNFSKFKILNSKTNPKNIIIGSSRIAYIGEDLLGEQSLNLSVGTATLEDQIVLSMMSIKHLNPKRIYLAADPWLFNKVEFPPHSLRWKNLEKEYLLSKKIIEEKVKKENFKIFTEMKNEKKTINQFLNNMYNLINLRQNKIYDENYFTNRTIIFPDGTEKFRVGLKKVEGKKFSRSFDPYIESPKKKDLFEKFIKYLINNKIEPIFLLIPIHEKSYELSIRDNNLLIDVEDYYLNFAKKNNLKIAGSYNPKKVYCEKDKFLDDIHPNVNCIKKIISQLNKN
jgi:peptidoglycan/LPS O-acetylase OafA/YrhL